MSLFHVLMLTLQERWVLLLLEEEGGARDLEIDFKKNLRSQ